MTEDKIIIGGVEYELGPDAADVSFTATMTGVLTGDCRLIIIRPKERKPAGLHCVGQCYHHCVFKRATIPNMWSCPLGFSYFKFEPYYDEVE